MARLFLSPSESSEIGRTQNTVFGHRTSAETAILQADSKTIFDGSFNAGGDTIRILGNAALYTAAIDGANLVLTAGNGARIVIPYGSTGATIQFNDAARVLAFNEAQGGVLLGTQLIEGPAEGVNAGSGDPEDTDTVFRLQVTPVDIINGTNSNDLFRATVQQNMLGQQANSLGTGDELDGRGGNDTLQAQLTEAVNLSGAAGAVQPISTDIEYLEFEALSNQQGSTYLQYGMTEIYVNAKDIDGHVRFASTYSDANLTIQDATTLDETGSIRNLGSLTVAMEYTGNDDSRWEESDFSVLFDQDYLNPELVAVRSARVELQAMNEDNWDKTTGAQPLAGVYFSQLQFTLNGVTYDLAPFIPAATDNRPGSDGRELQTYNELLTAVQAAIIGLKAANPGDAALQTLTASLGNPFFSDISPVTGTQREGRSIDLTVAPSTNGTTNELFANPTDLVLIPTPGLDPNVLPNSNRYERANFVPPESEEQLVINIDLEKVGRAGDGGELVVGSMNKYDAGPADYGEDRDDGPNPDTVADYLNLIPLALLGDESPWTAALFENGDTRYYDTFLGPNGVIDSLLGDFGRGTYYKSYPNIWNDDFAESGISTFNVTVYGGADKPSSLSGMHSTNNTLREVNVVTDAEQTGTYADLEIGNDNTVGGRRGSFKDVAIFNSTGFKGDLSLVAALTEELDSKYNPDNGSPTETPIMVRYDFGAGNDALDMEIGENFSQMTNVNINMGGGDDSAYVLIDGDTVDAVTESFFLNLGEGNNTAFVRDAEFYELEYERQDPQGVDNNVSGILFPNLTILSGTGADYIEIAGNGQYFISSGNGSDFVQIARNNFPGETSGGNNSGVDGDFWLWDPNLWGGIPDGLTPLDNGIALYRATLQVRFAGFEGTASVITGSDLIATETDLNNAIRTAIASNPELARMLETRLGTIDQNLLFRSLIGGGNQIEIALFQPELIPATATPVGTQVRLTAGETSALVSAMIATGMAEDSAIIAAIAADPAAGVQNADAAAYFNSVVSAAWGGPATPGVQHGTLNGTNGAADASLQGFVYYVHTGLGDEPGPGDDYLNHSVIDMGPGANDLVVLSPNDASHNVLVFDEPWGKVSIVNWFTNEDSLFATTEPDQTPSGGSGLGTFDGITGAHQLSLKGLYTSFAQISSSTSTESRTDKLIGIVDARATAQLTPGGQFQANNIVVTNVDRLEEATVLSTANPAPNLTFAGMTTTQIAAALNGTGGFGSDTEARGGVNQLISSTTTRQSLLFVENVDTPYQSVSAAITGTGTITDSPAVPQATESLTYANYGNYKVYRITYGDSANDLTTDNEFDGGSTGSHFSVTYLGELDFGNSLDLTPIPDGAFGNTTIDRYETGDREHYVPGAPGASGYDPILATTLNIVGGAYEIA